MNNKALSIATAALIASISANAQVVFEADFDGTPVTEIPGYGGGGFGAAITKPNLDDGSAVGSWTVNNAVNAPTQTAQAAIHGVDAGNVTNKALRFGIDGGFPSNSTILTGDLSSTLGLSNTITVSFDTYIATRNSNDRPVYFTGLDSGGRELFQLEFMDGSERLMYRDASDTRKYLGTASDVLNRGASSSPNNPGSDYDPTRNKNVAVTINASSFDVSLDGKSLSTGIAFKDSNADGLAQFSLGIGGNRFTGIFVDNLLITQNSGSGPTPFAITEIEYDPGADPFPTVTLTWRKTGADTYVAYLSRELSGWGEDLDDSITAEDDVRPEDTGHITVTFPLEGDRAEAEELFFRIGEG